MESRPRDAPRPLAVPLLVGVPQGPDDVVIEPDALGKLGAQLGVREQPRQHVALEEGRQRRHASDALSRRAVSGEVTQQRGRHLRDTHRQGLEAVALERDVVAVPSRLLGGIGVAVAVDQHAQVVRRFSILLAGSGEIRQPKRHHRVAHAVLHRLAKAQVRGVRQCRDELGDADLTNMGHGPSLLRSVP